MVPNLEAGDRKTPRSAGVAPPGAAELMVAFSRAESPEPGTSVPLAIASELCRAHGRQWEAEDEARAVAADEARLAAVKRRIDRMNASRSDLIDAIDSWMCRHVEQAMGAPLHTETIGSVIDRLSIAWVRARKLDGGLDGRRELAARQLRELGVAYDTLIAEVGAERRRVPDWRLLKSYGES